MKMDKKILNFLNKKQIKNSQKVKIKLKNYRKKLKIQKHSQKDKMK